MSIFKRARWGRRGTVALAVIGALIALRIALPGILLVQANKFLADFSPAYSLHMDDLDFSLWRGAYRFEGLKGETKANGQKFFEAEVIDVSVAWRELIRLRLLTDIEIHKPTVILTREAYDAVTASDADPKKDADKVASRLFPLRIERVTVDQGNLQLAEIVNLPEAERWRITGVRGRISNLTSTKRSPYTFLSAEGKIMDTSDVHVVAKASTQIKPVPWEAELELRHFDLVRANPWLKRWVPLTFTSGKADLYGEALSKDGRIDGYVKPFFSDVKVLSRREHYLGLKHFGIEVVAAFANRFLRTPSDKTVASDIDFEYDSADGFRWKKGVALTAALENGFGRPLAPGIEDRYDLINSTRGELLKMRNEARTKESGH